MTTSTRWRYGVALAIVVAPILAAAVRAITSHWYAASDDALFPLRALDAYTRHRPLVGTWSSGAGHSGINFNHPGPLMFYLLAVPVRLFGVSPGTVVGTATLNAAAAVAVVWLARRRAGSGFALATAVALLGLEWSMGTHLLVDPWNPHAATLPAAAMLFAAWSVVERDWVAAPVLVLAGSLALQLHLSYVLLVPALVLVTAAGAVVMRRVLPAGRAAGRPSVRWIPVAVAIGVLVWLPPLWQQLSGHPGNLTAMWQARQHPTASAIGLLRGARTLSAVVALPPWWLPPGWDRPTFATVRLGEVRGFEVGTAVGLLALAAVACVLAVVGAGALRERRGTVAAGSAVALAALAAAWLSASQASSPFGSIESYVRWMWPVALFSWLQIGLGLSRTETVRGAAAAIRRRARGALPAAGFACVAVLGAVGLAGALGGTDRGSGSIPWARDASRALADAAGPALAGKGPVLVHQHLDIGGDAVEPSVLVALLRHHVDFYVDEIAMSHQVGHERLFHGQRVKTIVWFLSSDEALSIPVGARRIALHRGLDAATEREYRRLRSELIVRLRGRGITITPAGLKLLQDTWLRGAKQLVAEAATDPTGILGGPVLESLLVNRVISPHDPSLALLRQYAPLALRWDRETVAIYAAPAGSPAAPRPNPLPPGQPR